MRQEILLSQKWLNAGEKGDLHLSFEESIEDDQGAKQILDMALSLIYNIITFRKRLRQ
jgi:hypothetical protein